MTLDSDVAAAEKSLVKMDRAMKDAVPCPGPPLTREQQLDGVPRKPCGRNCLPGQLYCRHHGGGIEVISRAASAIRLEAARSMIAQELAEGITSSVALYMAVVSDEMQKTADRIAAADRLVALAGGKDMLAGGTEDTELSGAQRQLQDLLLAAGDDRLERLALRLGAGGTPAPGDSDEVPAGGAQ